MREPRVTFVFLTKLSYFLLSSSKLSLRDAGIGFILVIDRRQDKWTSVKASILRIAVSTLLNYSLERFFCVELSSYKWKNIVFFVFNNMSANRWYRRYSVGLLYPRQSIMCLWCAFNAVCSSGHLPKCALGESQCVSMQLSQVGADGHPMGPIEFSLFKWRNEGEGPGWVYHLWKEFTWKNFSCDVWFKTRITCKQENLMCLLWSIYSACS